MKIYRGTFEPENNGPIITAELVEADAARELLRALRTIRKEALSTYRGELGAKYFKDIVDATLHKVGEP